MKIVKKEKKESKVPTKKERKIVEVSKAVRIPETDIIFTKGDKFEILEKEDESKKSQSIKENYRSMTQFAYQIHDYLMNENEILYYEEGQIFADALIDSLKNSWEISSDFVVGLAQKLDEYDLT